MREVDIFAFGIRMYPSVSDRGGSVTRWAARIGPPDEIGPTRETLDSHVQQPWLTMRN